MSLDGIDRPTVREATDQGRDRPTIRESAGSGIDRPTRREGSPASTGTAARRTYNLPQAILDSYEYLGDVDGATGGSGAAVVLCRELATDKEVVIKWYRGGEALADQRIMNVIEGADAQHVVPTRFEHEDGELWEVQEYFPLGTLDTVRRERGSRPFEADFVRSFLVELTDALDYLHSVGVVHRDLKPANVFVRKLKPLPVDLVIGDFNASIQAQETVLASVRATWAYAPPEAGSTEVSARGDWWPIGIMTYELLIGRHPLADPVAGLPNENTIRDRVFQNDIDLSAVTDERWSLLINGLLTWAEHDRWAAKEVREWLAGKSPVVTRTGPARHATGPITRGLPGIQPFVFKDIPYTDPSKLTTALVASWDAAMQQLAGRATERLRDFLTSAGFDTDYVARLINDSSPALTLLALQDAFVDGVPQFEGRSLAQESITDTARAAAGGDPAAGGWISDLRARGVLRALSRFVDDDGLVARASQRVDDWWYDIDERIDRMQLDADARAAVDVKRKQMEGQLLLAAFDDAAATAIRSEALVLARRRDDVIAWADDLRSNARSLDVTQMDDTGRAALALAVLPAARSLELGRLQGIRTQEAAARQAARADLLRARRARTGREFWLRLRIVIGYALLAGVASSLQFDGPNIVEWWMWPEFWSAFATAGISTLLLSLCVFSVETYVAPLRLGGRRQLFVGGVLLAIMLVWNQIFPAYGDFAISPSTWLIPPFTLLAVFAVAEGMNAVLGFRQTPAEELAGGEPWRDRATQGYVRGFTGLGVFAVVVLLIVVIGFAVEGATGNFASTLILDSAPPWVFTAANAMGHWFPAGAWVGSGGSGLALSMSAVVATIALAGLQRDIARRLPVVAALLMIAATLIDLAIVLSAPWELALALFYSVGVIIGAVILGIIIAIIFALA